MHCQLNHQLASEYAAKIKALCEEHEANLEALYREFQAKATEKANTEDLTGPGAGFSSQSTDESSI